MGTVLPHTTALPSELSLLRDPRVTEVGANVTESSSGRPMLIIIFYFLESQSSSSPILPALFTSYFKAHSHPQGESNLQVHLLNPDFLIFLFVLNGIFREGEYDERQGLLAVDCHHFSSTLDRLGKCQLKILT